MSSKAAAEFFAKGMEALQNDHVYLARVCFENAVNEERKPRYCSYLALTLAKSRKEFRQAIALAEDALAKEPGEALHYLNLGRVYLLAGNRQAALKILRQGANLGPNAEIIKELNVLGSREAPVIPALGRNHPLNKYLGLLLSRLGLRGRKK